MHIIKVLTKFFILPLFLLVFFNFSEYGFKWNRPEKFIYPVILMILTLVIFLKTKLRKFFLILSLVILLMMIFLYLVDEINMANIVGSFGFVLLIIVVTSYMSQIVKSGFIEKF